MANTFGCAERAGGAVRACAVLMAVILDGWFRKTKLGSMLCSTAARMAVRRRSRCCFLVREKRLVYT